ncbi:MAG: hypothetical protein OXT69_11250 [Candidatus Poribacteria bacterium]|nr:hypothetical protein [Candidatus Poribacteria bacterium]
MRYPRGAKRRFSYYICAFFFIVCCVFEASADPTPSPFISQLGLPDGAKLRIGRGRINSLAYSPYGRRLAVAGSIGVWIYDALFGREIALLRGHTELVLSAEYSPDGKRIVSGSGDKTVRIWDAGSGKELKTLTGIRAKYIQQRIRRTENESLAAAWIKRFESGTPARARSSKR